MKVARLLCAALALSFIAGWTTPSSACDNHKKAAKATTAAKAVQADAVVASSAGAVCTPEMMAACTPEMIAACKASMAAGGPDLCVGKKASASAAVAASAGADCCAKGAKGAKVSAAVASSPGYHGAAKTTAAVAAGAGDHCGTAKVSAVAAGAGGACGAKGAKASSAMAAGSACGGHGMASVAAVSGHADCDACVDMADCSGALDAAGAHRQAVRLKNGVMYVYTADSPRSVSAVQAAVAQRAERMARFASAGEKTRLCAECKALRGAMASGKLNREVVNIEGGSLTLLTSSDPKVVEKIHAMGDDKVALRVKS